MPAALVANFSISPGHGIFGLQTAIQGSDSITINNKPAHRLGDLWSMHVSSGIGNHNGTLATASTKTFWGNKGAGRVNDSVSCGSTATTGSSNTNID